MAVMRVIRSAVVSTMLVMAAYPPVRAGAELPRSQVNLLDNSLPIERGEYLVNSVAACFRCHASLDTSRLFFPVVAGTEGMGGQKMPVPGNLYASNITPASLGKWTDQDIVSATGLFGSQFLFQANLKNVERIPRRLL